MQVKPEINVRNSVVKQFRVSTLLKTINLNQFRSKYEWVSEKKVNFHRNNINNKQHRRRNATSSVLLSLTYLSAYPRSVSLQCLRLIQRANHSSNSLA